MSRLTTIASVDPSIRLAALTEQARAIAQELLALTVPLNGPDEPATPDEALDVLLHEQRLAAFARRYLQARRKRDTAFANDLFADPAWDMLLDLYVCAVQGRQVSISSACYAAAVPGTTALRWLGRLSDTGMIERIPDICDARRTFVTLTPSAKASVGQWLHQLLAGAA